MAKILHIVEISPHIYAGSVNTRASIDAPTQKGPNGYFTPSIPTGGIAFLFNKIYDYKGKGDMIFVADRNPTLKKEMFPGYKASRRNKKDPKAAKTLENVENQKEITEQILADCGFKVYAEDSYEADDIIYSICQKYGNDFDHIFIHAGDSDNYINVTNSISVLPASSSDKLVNRENYEVTVDKKSITPYCSSSFCHFLFGKASNDLPSLPKEWREKIIKLVWNEHHFPFMREKEPMRALIEHICPQAVTQFDVAYPLSLDVELTGYSDADWAKVEIWGGIIGCNRFRSKRRVTPAIQGMIDQFFSEGRALE